MTKGRKFACHEKLAKNPGIKVYFADPHSFWQGGINENTNVLLSPCLPKGKDLSLFTQDQVDQLTWELNPRPRKTLNFR